MLMICDVESWSAHHEREGDVILNTSCMTKLRDISRYEYI